MFVRPDGTATCRRCHQSQPAAAFYPLAYGGKGVRGVCRACFAAERRAQYAAGTTTRDKDRHYVAALKRKGLDPAEVQALLEAQDGRCAGCRGLPSPRRRLGTDVGPDGRLRGLLCRSCGLVVGAVDDPEVLRRLSLYIGGAVR
jgi:hypothetical protein